MEELTGNDIKDICIDEGINSVYRDVKSHNHHNLFSQSFSSKLNEFGSVKLSFSERMGYSLGSSFEEVRNTTHAVHETGSAEPLWKRTDEKPYIPPINENRENVKVVSLACLLKKERENYGFDLLQESKTEELIPLEEFNRRYCSLQMCDSLKKGVGQKSSDIIGCPHPASSVDESHQSARVKDAFVHSNGVLDPDDQGILPDPDQSTSASNNGHPKGGISVASTFSLSPISTSSHEEIHGPKQPSNTSELASSVQRASFDHSGAVNSSVLYSSSFSHQNLHPSQPNFGNISLRSESSTTSTRSFAFPVVQSEWNGSPVRMMARVDRGRVRRQRWWVPRISCFKF